MVTGAKEPAKRDKHRDKTGRKSVLESKYGIIVIGVCYQ
jgi:hypothetical protein